MSKNKQKANRRPPLSVLDKTIYTAVFVLWAVLLFLLVVITNVIQEAVALKDNTVIAYRNNGCELLATPLFCNILLSAIILYYKTCANKLPIFGNKNIRYGEYPWQKDLFPLFGPQSKPKHLDKRKKDAKKALLGLWLFIFAITLFLFYLSLFGRTVMHEDNSISSYDLLNEQSERIYTEGDFRSVTIVANHLIGSKGTKWYVLTTIEMADGRSVQFENTDFKNTDIWLTQLEKIKAAVPSGTVEYSGAKYLEGFANYYSYSDVQTNRLFGIFEQAP